MKIALVHSSQAFHRTALDEFLETALEKFKEFGHDVGLVRIPFDCGTTELLLTSMIAATVYRIREVDRVIVHSFPSCYVPHENKVAWLFRQFEATPGQDNVDAIVRAADRQNLPEGRSYAASIALAGRLKRFSGLQSTVMYPPVARPEFRCDEFGDFVLYPSARSVKGQEDMVRALASTRSGVRLHAIVSPENVDSGVRMADIARDMNVEAKITLEPEPLECSRKIELYARCLAVAHDASPDGTEAFIASQAFASKKPLLLLDTAGGAAEAGSADGSDGVIVSSNVPEMAVAMDRLFEDRPLAHRLGAASCRLSTSWHQLIEGLTK